MTDHDDPIGDALRALPREMTPPPHVGPALETMNRRRRRARAVRQGWRVALAASLLMAAFVTGRATSPRAGNAPAEGRAFAFLLYGGGTTGTDDRAAEYGAWALELRTRGVAVSGERLADQSWIAGNPRPADAVVRGFFIVRAPDGAAAVEMARRHPHAAVGTIEVRPIDTP